MLRVAPRRAAHACPGSACQAQATRTAAVPWRAQCYRRQRARPSFQADAPNQKWVADFTYIWTAEGWLYVAVVLDLYSRRAVGWSMQSSMTSQLVADALMMAVWRRGKPVALLHHSDQRSQYTSEHFQDLLKAQGITCSMSRAGEVWDNSAMESFFSGLKTERTARKVYRSREQPRSDAVRLHRTVRQPAASPLDARIRQSDRVRESSRNLGRCPLNRQQLTAHFRRRSTQTGQRLEIQHRGTFEILLSTASETHQVVQQVRMNYPPSPNCGRLGATAATCVPWAALVSDARLP